MAASTVNTNKPIIPRGVDDRPVDKYNRASLFSGKALDFDGVNDYVAISDNAALNFGTGDFSIAFVMKSDVAGFDRVLDKRDLTNGYTINIGPSKNIVLELNDGTGSSQFATSTIYADGKLKHVVISFDRSGNADFYINGAFDEGVDISSKSGNLDSTSDLFIGADAPSGTGIFYDGQLSGLKMYSTTLTAAQVADLYNNPEKVVPTGVSDSALKLWLPMQEGAGTTAYDGSGNGNHGTISGATWVQGVGAPVAQTAVIDWNKLYVFDKTDDYASTTSYTDVTGTKTYKVSFEVFDTSTDEQQIFQFFNVSAGKGVVATYNTFGTYKRLGFRGYASGADFGASSWNDVEHNTPYELVFTINWDTETLESISLSGDAPVGTSTARMNPVFTGLVVGYRWNAYPFGGFINYFEVVGEEKWTNASGFKSESGSYDMTISGSPTQILAPQGLTSGRDITGVNLFENVRKQGALNLDGNSWAEVHDNASLDFGTGSFSLEAWAKVKYVAQGSSYNVIMSMGLNISNAYSVGMLVNQQLEPIFIYNNTGTAESARTEGEWLHIVGTYDETSATIYVNGVQKDQDVRTTVDTTNPLVKHIGRDTTSVRFYNDQIAQPRIYNRALTASEVLNNYNATSSLYI